MFNIVNRFYGTFLSALPKQVVKKRKKKETSLRSQIKYDSTHNRNII